MYAIIETGGKQVKVEVGLKIYVEKLDVEVGSSYTFDKVLLVSDNEHLMLKVLQSLLKLKNKVKNVKS